MDLAAAERFVEEGALPVRPAVSRASCTKPYMQIDYDVATVEDDVSSPIDLDRLYTQVASETAQDKVMWRYHRMVGLRLRADAVGALCHWQMPVSCRQSSKALGHRFINRIQIRAEANFMRARQLASCVSKRMAMALKCLTLLKKRSVRLR